MGVIIQGYGANSGNNQQVDALFSAARVCNKPLDITNFGWFSQGLTSGSTGSVASAANIFSFRWAPGLGAYCFIRRVRIAAIVTTAYPTAQAIDFQMVIARNFTASDSAGTAANFGDMQSKYRSSYQTTAVTDMRITSTTNLTVGTRTLDAAPIGAVAGWATTSKGTGITTMTPIFQHLQGDHPLILQNMEGFVIQPITAQGATGKLKIYVDVEWGEILNF